MPCDGAPTNSMCAVFRSILTTILALVNNRWKPLHAAQDQLIVPISGSTCFLTLPAFCRASGLPFISCPTPRISFIRNLCSFRMLHALFQSSNPNTPALSSSRRAKAGKSRDENGGITCAHTAVSWPALGISFWPELYLLKHLPVTMLSCLCHTLYLV